MRANLLAVPHRSCRQVEHRLGGNATSDSLREKEGEGRKERMPGEGRSEERKDEDWSKKEGRNEKTKQGGRKREAERAKRGKGEDSRRTH